MLAMIAIVHKHFVQMIVELQAAMLLVMSV